MRRPAATVLAATVVAAVGLVSGCSGSTISGHPQQSVTPVTLDPAALHYGAAVSPKPGVTLQPDVVLVQGGGAAVRAVTDGGLTWTLDPAAAGVGKLAVGRVMFVTGRGAGRVINVRHSGDGTVVTIAPAGITDIIRDGAFTGDTPISLEDPLTYSAGDAFWSAGGSTRDAGLPGNRFAAGRPTTLPVPTRGGSGSVTAGGFAVTAHCCKSGAELGFTYDGGDIRLAGSFALQMAQPHATFDLRISGGTVTRAKLELGGAVGIKVDIAGAARAFHTVDKLIPIPMDFNVPIANVLGVPLSADVNQVFAVHTFFSSKDGNIKATGDWNINSALGFTYEDGAFKASAPTSITKKIAVLDTISGIATGVTGIALDYQTRVTVGIGAFGFTAGLYFTFAIHLYLVRGSALGSPIAVCNMADLSLWTSYGVGYSIPKPVADLVNFFLEKFGSRPIEKRGGIGKDAQISFHKVAYQPDSDFCRKQK